MDLKHNPIPFSFKFISVQQFAPKCFNNWMPFHKKKIWWYECTVSRKKKIWWAHATHGLPLIIYAKFRSNTTNLNIFQERKGKKMLWRKYNSSLANTLHLGMEIIFFFSLLIATSVCFFIIFLQTWKKGLLEYFLHYNIL